MGMLENIKLLQKIVTELNTDIVIGMSLNLIKDCLLFVVCETKLVPTILDGVYKIGTFGGKCVYMNTNMVMGDLRILDTNGKTICDLSEKGFDIYSMF